MLTKRLQEHFNLFGLQYFISYSYLHTMIIYVFSTTEYIQKLISIIHYWTPFSKKLFSYTFWQKFYCWETNLLDVHNKKLTQMNFFFHDVAIIIVIFYSQDTKWNRTSPNFECFHPLWQWQDRPPPMILYKFCEIFM